MQTLQCVTTDFLPTIPSLSLLAEMCGHPHNLDSEVSSTPLAHYLGENVSVYNIIQEVLKVTFTTM